MLGVPTIGWSTGGAVGLVPTNLRSVLMFSLPKTLRSSFFPGYEVGRMYFSPKSNVLLRPSLTEENEIWLLTTKHLEPTGELSNAAHPRPGGMVVGDAGGSTPWALATIIIQSCCRYRRCTYPSPPGRDRRRWDR